MAKESMKAREVKRQKMVAKYAEKRAALKKAGDYEGLQKLPRDASQQAEIGETLSFIEESESGDLAFFDNDEGVIMHVGIMLENNRIIHASGKVRIDKIDHQGIFNVETNTYSHRLRLIKKVL